MKICEEQLGSALRIIREESSLGRSAANGRAEAAVRSRSGIVISLLSRLARRIGSKIRLSHPIFAWIVSGAGALYNLLQTCADGLTPDQGNVGRSWKEGLAEFGEAGMAKVKTKKKSLLRWYEGVYLGVVANSCEKLV